MLGLAGRLWRRNIGIRLVATLLAASWLLGAVASWLNYRAEERVYREQLMRYGRTLAQAAAFACPDAILTTDRVLLQSYVEELGRSDAHVAHARVERASDSKVLARFANAALELSPEDVVAFSADVRIEDGARPLGRFVLGLSLQPMRAVLQQRARELFWQTTSTFVLAALAVSLLLRSLVIAPLRRLDEHAMRLGAGRLAEAIPDFGETEIGRLATTLEEMRRNLAASHESLAQQNQRLRELDYMKSQFLANVSHEIRTPINSILGSIELLQEPGVDAGERNEHVARLHRNGVHLLQLINTLLDFAKIESGNLLVDRVPCRLAAVVDDVIACVRTLTDQKQLYLRSTVHPATPEWVLGDPMRLRQILINVVGNAAKFTDHGGIEVAVRPVPGVSPQVEICVTDTGIGIPEASLPQIFEPFKQVDGSITRRFGGAGLGLAIARKLAQHLGGDISLQSTVDRGTSVRITIEAGEVAAPAAVEAPLALQGFAGRVLLVEDSPDNQRLLSVMLRKAGVDVEVASNGRIGVERVMEVRAAGGTFDLILMDIQMPEMDGIAAIEWLRRRDVATPIVALTAHALSEDRDRCLAAGSNGYETKPISRARLAEVLARFLPGLPAGAPDTADAVGATAAAVG